MSTAMTEDVDLRTTGASTPQVEKEPEEGRGFGWLLFAGTMLGVAGFMRILDSIWAFGYKGALPEGLKDSLLGSQLQHYAWTWLGVGILMLVSALLLLTRSQFARWVGLFSAGILGVSAVLWLPYYPVWSLVYVGLSALVIYGLATYGGRETV